jgi:TolB-like protein/Tfp pilus assembly protein PilF
MELLLLLVEREGDLVTREEIRGRLWGGDVFVDVEAGINTAVRKLRKALDDGDGTVYLGTLAGKGYCFAAKVKQRAVKPAPLCVAVLPVENLDASPGSRYLADGVTEELIAALGQAAPERIRVVGRTTMMRYKGTSQALSAVAAETGANFLVESSLRSEGASIRLVSRLIEATDQTQLWGQTFNGERRASVLALQHELSQAVASRVQAQLAPGRQEAFARRQSANATAYDLYLRGRYLWHQLSSATTRRAIDHFQRAAALDETYSLAWAGLAVCHAAAPITGDASALQVLAPARNAVAQGKKWDPDLAETHTAEGFLQFWLEWNYVRAEECFLRASELDSSDATAQRTLAVVLAYENRGAEAEQWARLACKIDPLNSANFALAAQVAYFARDWRKAEALARRAIEVDSNMWVGHLQLAQALERTGSYEAALAALTKAGGLSGNNSKVLALQGYIQAVTERRNAAEEGLRELAALRAGKFVPPYAEATVWLGLGKWEEAARCLDRCIEVHDVHLSFLLADAKWDPVRKLPWFDALVSRCGFVLPG